jgi:peptide/nickel transport system substrate-binding protein
MSELLNPTTKEPIQSDIKTIKNLVSLSFSSACFTFTIAPTSAYIWSGHLPDGIPLDFFNNTHTRKAFAYAFNRTECITQPPYTESICRETPLIQGLYPDYHTSQTAYAVSFSAAEAELKQAVFGGTNAWDAGFKMTLPYLMGSDVTRIAFEQLKNFFANLSTYDGRTGPPFQISVAELDPRYYIEIQLDELPIWVIGWLADYADADNFIRPYMHSNGDFAYFQNYTADNGWGKLKDQLIDTAINTPDGPQRASLYTELEHVYINDCPSIPLLQPLSRMWMKYWVKGWYYNPLTNSPQSGYYYYQIWKYDNCWYCNSGPTSGISDGIVGMRDISYTIIHFSGRAPDPSRSLDPKWVPVYGANGCVDTYGDRTVNMRDIANAILHFNHKNNTLTP